MVTTLTCCVEMGVIGTISDLRRASNDDSLRKISNCGERARREGIKTLQKIYKIRLIRVQQQTEIC